MLVQRKARRANSYTRSTNPPPAKPIRKRTAKGGRLSLSWLANRGSRIQREHTRTKRHRDLGWEPLSRMLRRESTGKATSWVPDPIGESADDHGCHASEKGPFFAHSGPFQFSLRASSSVSAHYSYHYAASNSARVLIERCFRERNASGIFSVHACLMVLLSSRFRVPSMHDSLFVL